MASKKKPARNETATACAAARLMMIKAPDIYVGSIKGHRAMSWCYTGTNGPHNLMRDIRLVARCALTQKKRR